MSRFGRSCLGRQRRYRIFGGELGRRRRHGPSLYVRKERGWGCSFFGPGWVRKETKLGKGRRSGMINGISDLLPIPNLHQIITPSCHEPPPCPKFWLTAHQTPRRRRWRPTHRIDTHSMRLEYLVCPTPLMKLKNADHTVRRGAGE